MGKLLLVSLFFIYNSLSANEKAVVAFLQGDVFIKESESEKLWRALQINEEVKEGSTIKTGPKSVVVLKGELVEIRVSPSTSLKLDKLVKGIENGNIKIRSGFAWFKFRNLRNRLFTVSTPSMTAGVRGTSFASTYDEVGKKSKFCVCEGTIQVGKNFRKNEKLLELTYGKGSTSVSDGKPVKEIYREEIVRDGKNFPKFLPTFKKRLEDSPMMANCLSCHEGQGWKADGIIPDQDYREK